MFPKLTPEQSVRLAVWFVVLSAAFAMNDGLIMAARNWNSAAPPSWAETATSTNAHLPARDIDTWNIHRGLLLAPGFFQTLRWWTGPWVLGTAYYRPLSSVLFWFDWKIFGDHEVHWIVTAALIHLFAVWQFALLTAAIARHFRCQGAAWATLLSGMIFVSGVYLFPLRPATCYEVFSLWKNQPDSLCTAFFCMAIRRYLQGMPAYRAQDTVTPAQDLSQGGSDTPSRIQSNFPAFRRLLAKHRDSLAALGLFLLAVAAKEPGLIVVPLLVWLELPQLFSRRGPERSQACIRLAPLLVGIVFVLLWRAHCIDNSVALRLLHPKAAWRNNILTNAFGPALAAVAAQRWTLLAAGCALAALSLLARYTHRRRQAPVTARSLLGWIVAGALLLIMAGSAEYGSEYDLQTRVAIAAISYFDPGKLSAVLAIAVFLLGVWQAIRTVPLVAGLGVLWVECALVTTLPLQTLAYHYYLLEGGYALIVGIGLLQLLPMRPAEPPAAAHCDPGVSLPA